MHFKRNSGLKQSMFSRVPNISPKTKEKKKSQMALLTELSKPEKGWYTWLTFLSWGKLSPVQLLSRNAMVSLTENLTGNSALSYSLQFVECGSVSLCRHNWRASSTTRITSLRSAKICLWATILILHGYSFVSSHEQSDQKTYSLSSLGNRSLQN